MYKRILVPLDGSETGEAILPFATKIAGPLDAESIIRKVADHYGTTVAQIKGKRRDKALVTARQVAMHLVREMTASSLPEIGRLFGGKDHTTVIHACSKIKTALKEDPPLALAVRELSESLRQTAA